METYKIVDNGVVRDATPEEAAEIDIRKATVIKVVVPQSVSRRQARQALLLDGLLDKVQPAIDAIEDSTQRGLAQIEWDDSQVFERNRPILGQLATSLGLDSDGLDTLFIKAATL